MALFPAAYRRPECRRRFVMFAGPGKTGSTSIQKFFSRDLATSIVPGSSGSVGRTGNWTFPINHYGPYCPMLLIKGGPRIAAVSNDTRRKIGSGISNAGPGANFFWACEAAALHWRIDPRGRALQAMTEAMGVTGEDGFCPEFVFNYRTPRLDHLLSAWKQVTRPDAPEPFRNVSIHRLACDKSIDRKGFRFLLPKFLNPLRAALDYRQNTNATITIIDLAGVANASRDVSHVLACDVLGMPCRDGWYGGNEVIRANRRERDSVDLSESERVALERLLRQRDCAYRDAVVGDERVQILYQYDLWPDCPEVVPEYYQKLDDQDFFLDQIERILSCPGSKSLPAFNGLGIRGSIGRYGGAHVKFDTSELQEQRDMSILKMEIFVTIATAAVVLYTVLLSARRRRQRRRR